MRYETHLEVREELKWQEGAGKRGGEGAREEEKGTNGDSLGWVVLEFSARALAANVSILLARVRTHTHTHPTTCGPGGSCLHTWLGAFTPRLRPFHTWTTQPPPRDLSSICLQKGCLFPSENGSNQHFPLAGVAYQQLLHKVRNCNFSFSFAWLASPFCPLSLCLPRLAPTLSPLRAR